MAIVDVGNPDGDDLLLRESEILAPHIAELIPDNERSHNEDDGDGKLEHDESVPEPRPPASPAHSMLQHLDRAERRKAREPGRARHRADACRRAQQEEHGRDVPEGLKLHRLAGQAAQKGNEQQDKPGRDTHGYRAQED